ncbi:hypothetical protein MMC13_001897 [Lambiella insularis]|nr:hypothetical protein [Lambiella insularis]
MPRPKRTKIAHSVSNLVATREHTDVLPQVSSRVTTNSDDSEGIVKSLNNSSRRMSSAHGNVSMSGALAPQDVQHTARLRPPSGRQRVALSKIARDGDHARAIEALKKRRDEATARERAPGTAQQVPTFKAAVQLHDQIAIPVSPPKAVESAATATVEEEQEDLLAERRVVGRVKPVPFSSCKHLSTPLADSSKLALANFKRRARQPSILQIGDQGLTSSESELSEMLDDFLPDEESTPFHITRSQTLVRPTASHLSTTSIFTSSAQQPLAPGSRKRKLTTPRVQVPDSQSSPIRLPSSPPRAAYISIGGPIASSHVPPHFSEPELPSEMPQDLPTEAIWSDTMAPPQSSSPPQSPAKAVQTVNAVNRALKPHPMSQRRPLTAKLGSKQSSTAMQSNAKVQPLSSISTATLQSLLPRRRYCPARRVVSDFEIPGSSDAESETHEFVDDEDELSFTLPAESKRASKTSRRSNKLTEPTATVKKKTPRSMSRAVTTGKGKDLEAAITYSRRMSDKENTSRVELGIDTNQCLSLSSANDANDTPKAPSIFPVKVKKELKTLVQKFKEVDQWEMEFEELTASSSSPWDAR